MLKHKFSGKRRAYIVTMRTLMTLAALAHGGAGDLS